MRRRKWGKWPSHFAKRRGGAGGLCGGLAGEPRRRPQLARLRATSSDKPGGCPGLAKLTKPGGQSLLKSLTGMNPMSTRSADRTPFTSSGSWRPPRHRKLHRDDPVAHGPLSMSICSAVEPDPVHLGGSLRYNRLHEIAVRDGGLNSHRTAPDSPRLCPPGSI
jgi:hypothetical protein